jgi:hypothetical protein
MRITLNVNNKVHTYTFACVVGNLFLLNENQLKNKNNTKFKIKIITCGVAHGGGNIMVTGEVV